MSKDIRSFFSVLSKKPSSISAGKNKPIVSSDEDVIQDTPEDPKKKATKKRKIQVLSSDSETDSPKPKASRSKDSNSKNDSKAKHIKNSEKSKLKPVNIADVFSNAPIKQSKVEVAPEVKSDKEPKKRSRKSRKQNTFELHTHAEELDRTLFELNDDDDDILLNNVDILDKTVDEALSKEKEYNRGKTVINVEPNPLKENQESGSSHLLQKHSPAIEASSTSSKDRKRLDKDGHTSETPSKKRKKESDSEQDSHSGIDPDQERYEKKKYSAMLYQKYLNRGGPKHQGMKELPNGKPDCLKDLCFLRTGVLDSLDSESFELIIKQHGGRVVHGVSRKVNYVVVGEDAGPAKLAKAESYKISQLSEDDLLNMIRVKSGLKVERKESHLSEDTGIDVDSDFLTNEDLNDATTSESGGELKKCSPQKPADDLGNDNKPNLKKLQNVKVKNVDIGKKPVRQDTKKDQGRSPKKENKLMKEEKIHKKGVVQMTKVKPAVEDAPVSKMKSEEIKRFDRKKTTVSNTNISWTDKYKPTDIKSIIGQQGESSTMNKLRKWLQNWQKHHGDKTKKHVRPSPWAKNDDGSYFKCALLSGSPGVGKTTTATLVSKDLGFDIVEFNASDTRSKKLLHQEVAQLLNTQTLAGFATGQAKTSKKRVLLMDEVDGMAGNEDRGGLQELINLIKNSSVPIICMCNDRNHQKMRTLSNYCFDLRFPKPRLEQIRGAMMSVCFKEGVNIKPQALTEIISGTGCDIRQTLTHLSMWSASDKNLTQETAEKESKVAKKDTILGPWEVVKMVFNETDQQGMSFTDKTRLFFYDYSLGPLFVHENYIRVKPHINRNGLSRKQAMRATLKQYALTADAISMGDLIDSKIRRSNNWSLLETQAIFSSVLPGHYMSGHFEGQINFPGWLGKNSKRTKHNRMLSEIQIHTRQTTQASKLAVRLDYLVPLRNAILYPLKNLGSAGIQKAVNTMKVYNLLREDFDSLIELTKWSKQNNLYANIDVKVKSAFTRTYNKEVPLLPFAVTAGVAKKKASVAPQSLEDEDELLESDNEDNDDIGADAMIKVKAPSKGKKKADKPSTSKAGEKTSENKKGRGKKSK